MSDETPTTQIFPDQIILEILTRLPVKKVFQSKIISKGWNSLISTTHFINTFTSRTPPDWRILDRVVRVELTGPTRFTLPLVPEVGSLTVTPPLAPEDDQTQGNFAAVIAASNGLVLVASSRKRDPYKERQRNPDYFSIETQESFLFVVNPVTSELATLPNPRRQINRGSIVFSTRLCQSNGLVDRFLVTLYQPLIGSDFASVSCFSSETWKWEEFQGVYMLNNHMWRSDGSFELDGVLFWTDLSCGLIYLNDNVQPFGDGKRGKKKVEFEYIGLPKRCQRPFNTMGLENTRRFGVGRDLEGGKDFIQFFDVGEKGINLWRLKDYKIRRWNLEYTVTFPENNPSLLFKPLFFHPFNADGVFLGYEDHLLFTNVRHRLNCCCGSHSNSAGIMSMVAVVIPSWPSPLPSPSAEAAKELGNEYFKAKEYDVAILWYSRSIVRLPTAVAYANRAAGYLNIHNFFEAEKDCTEALKLDVHFIKAYWRRAVARKELGKLKEALDDAEHALNLNPLLREVQKLRDEVKSLFEQETPEGNGEGSMVTDM